MPRSINVFCFFDVFIAVAVVVATALYFDLKGHSLMAYGKTHVPKFVYSCSETTGYYENGPVLLSGTFYTYSVRANKNETFIINEDMKNHECFVI